MKIGYYTAECCLLDLHRIDTEEELQAARERQAETGPPMVFATLADAIEALRGALPPEEEAREFERLGWDKWAEAKANIARFFGTPLA